MKNTNVSKELIRKAMKINLDKREEDITQIKASSLAIMSPLKEGAEIPPAWGFINYIQDCVKNGEIELAKNHIERKAVYLKKEEVQNE